MTLSASVVEAAKTALTLSGTGLRRNSMDHDSPSKNIPLQLKRCVERIVHNVRKGVAKKYLDGFYLQNSS